MKKRLGIPLCLFVFSISILLATGGIATAQEADALMLFGALDLSREDITTQEFENAAKSLNIKRITNQRLQVYGLSNSKAEKYYDATSVLPGTVVGVALFLERNGEYYLASFTYIFDTDVYSTPRKVDALFQSLKSKYGEPSEKQQPKAGQYLRTWNKSSGQSGLIFDTTIGILGAEDLSIAYVNAANTSKILNQAEQQQSAVDAKKQSAL
ncbi:hypothetical protein [uncultured Desulfuromonas sp.]|uniref:hypothetical protein n=1 Tax=uncultured Desulfuromonas sp. TaxID=181013 RepID=UPI002AAC3C55|nr:hypothetical protein [uncultured Desulfuromonas sp.]